MWEPREIEAFMAVAAELHFGPAAERLQLTTSTVSQTIQALERRIGAPLFERTSRRTSLTPLGEHLLGDVRPAYEQLQRALRDAQHLASERTPTLVVGFSASLLPGMQ